LSPRKSRPSTRGTVFVAGEVAPLDEGVVSLAQGSASFAKVDVDVGELAACPDEGPASPDEEDARLAWEVAYLAGVDASVGDLAASRGGGDTPLVGSNGDTAAVGPYLLDVEGDLDVGDACLREVPVDLGGRAKSDRERPMALTPVSASNRSSASPPHAHRLSRPGLWHVTKLSSAHLAGWCAVLDHAV
jgi:hypothetical protein